MKEASFYNELTRNEYLLYTIKYEKNHPVIMEKIENNIMNAVENGQYMVSIDFDFKMISAYDVQMIPKVLGYYGFTVEWVNTEPANIGILNIHWA